jgi:hypothetical protein
MRNKKLFFMKGDEPDMPLINVADLIFDEGRLQFLACLGEDPDTRIKAMEKLPPKKENVQILNAISALDDDDGVKTYAQQLFRQRLPI